MPLNYFGGQLITFAAQNDPDTTPTSTVVAHKTRKNDTLRAIVARYGNPESVEAVLTLNKRKRVHWTVRHGRKSSVVKLIHSYQQMPANVTIYLPGSFSRQPLVHVLAGDEAPLVKDGYAKYDVVNRPGGVGINRFLGYDPLKIDVPIVFEEYTGQAGDIVESSIAALEHMAGRGAYRGAGSGPPSVVRVSVTDNHGNIVPLVPANYQWTPQNPQAPVYRIADIAWQAGELRDNLGRRVRSAATVTLVQFTPLSFASRSVAQRARKKKK